MVVKLHWMFRYFKKLLTSFTLRLNTLLTVLLSLSHFTAVEKALVCFLKDAPCHYRESPQGSAHRVSFGKKMVFLFLRWVFMWPRLPLHFLPIPPECCNSRPVPVCHLPGCVSRSSCLAELYSCSMGSVGRCHS